MSVHGPDPSDCGASGGCGCSRDVEVLLGEAQHVLLGAGEVVDQHCGFCYLPDLLNSTLAGLGAAVVFDPSVAVDAVAVSAEAGSSPLLLLHSGVAAAS